MLAQMNRRQLVRLNHEPHGPGVKLDLVSALMVDCVNNACAPLWTAQQVSA
jgi:hypothetical protein